MKKTIILNGDSLTIADLAAITRDPAVTVQVDTKIYPKIERAHKFVQSNINKKIIYGVNTGFGPMASHILDKDHLVELQYNLIRSHSVGMGDPLDSSVVLAAMVVRLNTLAKGSSGVSVGLLNTLEKFINKRVIPVVPEHGAVGTSGDLVQLAHIALALIGEGQVMHNGKTYQTAKLLPQLKIAPHALLPKEGLSLINGTSVMSAAAALSCFEAERAIDLAITHGALSFEIVEAFDDSIMEKLHTLRPHYGQIQVAARLREILASSRRMRDRESLARDFKHTSSVHQIEDRVQEVYSLRCIPQIIGPIFDTLENTKKVVEIEINSVTDNPIVDLAEKRFLHGGNFHGDYIAAAIDQLKIAMVKLTMLSERRINFFLNRNINKVYPPFLNIDTPGLTLGLQGLQFVATSTTADNQSLAFPHHIHSISTNADNQDVVSMGTDAVLFARKVIDNAYIVLTIELVALTQAVDHLGITKKLSVITKKLYTHARSEFPVVREDRSFSLQLAKLTKSLRQ